MKGCSKIHGCKAYLLVRRSGEGFVQRRRWVFFNSLLDEYVFRFNRRTTTFVGKRFMRIVQQAVISQPIPYRKLIQAVAPVSDSVTGVL